MPARFIAIEGLDGSGISTQTRRLAANLDEHGLRYYCTREPTDGPIGSQLRLALSGRLQFDHATLALLYAADRCDHVHTVVLPRLAAGIHVVTERHVLSSLAYQGAQLSDPDWVREINRAATRAIRPDLTIFLDVPPETALRRIDEGRHARELFEREDTLAATRASFLGAIDDLRAGGWTIDILDATAPIARVEQEVLDRVLATLTSG